MPSNEPGQTLRFSISDLTYFSDCRRRWYWERTYAPKKPNSVFWLGTIVHSGLEGYFKNKEDMTKGLQYFEKKVQGTMSELREEFGSIWSSIIPEFDELYGKAELMLQNYPLFDRENRLRGDVLEKGVERYERVPLFVDEKGRQIQISGKIDLVLGYGGGKLHLVDHKTSSSAVSPNGLDVDEQMTGYSWMLYKTIGRIPEMVTYDVLIKSIPEEPRRLKDGTLSLDKGQNTLHHLYLDELIKDGLQNDSKYQPTLAALKSLGWSKYYQRLSSTRNQSEIDSFQRRAVIKCTDMLRILDDPENYAYPSPSTYRCNGCPFITVCKSKDDGGDAEYLLETNFKKGSW